MNKLDLVKGLDVLNRHLLDANMQFYLANYGLARAAVNDAHDQLIHLQAQLIDAPDNVTQ
jgi:hypothetical protein